MRLEYLICSVASAVSAEAHVQLLAPPSIIDSDYQYTFAPGVCVRETCDAFCGDSDDNPIITSVQPDEESNSIDVQLLITNRHPPFKYRVSLHDGDIDTISGFDTTVLLDNFEMESRSGWVKVPIPRDVTCDPYCVLQLFDYYYFVSCSKITLGEPSNQTEIGPSDASETVAIESEVESMPSEPPKPSFLQEEIIFENIPAVRITMAVSLDYLTFLALGISSYGGMVGSTAVVGSISEKDNVIGGMITETGIYDVTNTTIEEFTLGGKFIEEISPTPDAEKIELKSTFAIDYWQLGTMNHTLEVILRKETEDKSSTICGKKIIWAHSPPTSPSMSMSYHVGSKGVHSAPVICGDEIETSHAEVKGGSDNADSPDVVPNEPEATTNARTTSPTNAPTVSVDTDNTTGSSSGYVTPPFFFSLPIIMFWTFA